MEERYWGEPTTVHREGSQLHYWLLGPADAPLVSLTHGASMDHRMFDQQKEVLLDAGYRVLAWDIRGHGCSKPIGDSFDLSTVVEDLITILDRIGVDEVTPVGHSFGGYVSQELCFRHPDRVPALAVVGSSDVTVAPSGTGKLALQFSPYLFQFLPSNTRHRLVADSTAERPHVQRYAHNATSQLSRDEFVTVWKAVVDAMHPEPGYEIGVPWLLTHGDADAVGTIAKHAPEWAEREPHCRYEVIPDAGHNANQDNPDVYNEYLLSFLQEHVPA